MWVFQTLKPSSKHVIYILALSLLVSWISFTVNKQTPPPDNKETVFATPLQSRFGFHSCRRLDAGEMLTLSQQWWTTFKGVAVWGGLDGTSVHWRHKCTGSCGQPAEASESIGCWRRQRQIWLAHLGQLARKGGGQASEDEGCHGDKRCKWKTKTVGIRSLKKTTKNYLLQDVRTIL